MKRSRRWIWRMLQTRCSYRRAVEEDKEEVIQRQSRACSTRHR
jgi:hypothetical protein